MASKAKLVAEVTLEDVYALGDSWTLRASLENELGDLDARLKQHPKDYYRAAVHETASRMVDLIWTYLAQPHQDKTRGAYLPVEEQPFDYRAVATRLSGELLENSLNTARDKGIY